MARGRGHVPAPGVDLPEPQLDLRQRSLVADARRRLERGDRPRVVAQRRADLADRDLEPHDVRVPEGEGRLEVLERLAVRVDAPRPEPGLAVGLGGGGVTPGGLLVAGDLREPARVVAAGRIGTQHLGDAPVEEPAARQADVLVRRVAQAGVPEVEGRLTTARELADDPPSDELLERR